MMKNNMDKPKEECGVYAIYGSDTYAIKYDMYYALYALQHRGEQSAGMAISYANIIEHYKDNGLVDDVFKDSVMKQLQDGDIALGHVRYGTKDTNIKNAQPMVYENQNGPFAICMNGRIINAPSLRQKLKEEGFLFSTESDVEVIAVLFNKLNAKNANMFIALKETLGYLKGAFSIAVMTTTSLIVARDQYGQKPLVLGKRFDDYHISSESCALEALGASVVRDIKPGEIMQINSAGIKSELFVKSKKVRPCIFEFIYTARSDSVIDGQSVYKARYQCGKELAKKIKIKADIVSGVPDSANVVARGFAVQSKIPFIDVLEKNRYVSRTFMQPTQIMRENAVKLKLNVNTANVNGKKIILIDDSIVRGTTSKKIVSLLKQHGAKEVHLVIASPMLKFSCYSGVDIKREGELIAANKTVSELTEIIGVDSLHFMTVKELVKCCSSGNFKTFCTACFDGKYPDDLNKEAVKEEELYGY